VGPAVFVPFDPALVGLCEIPDQAVAKLESLEPIWDILVSSRSCSEHDSLRRKASAYSGTLTLRAWAARVALTMRSPRLHPLQQPH
jgi:hypothetical protein